MLVEKLKEIVVKFNNALDERLELYHFHYGKGHWQNLLDLPNDELMPFEQRNKYLQLFWQDRDNKINDYSAITGADYTGEMLLTVRSKFDDPSYEYKYETHIKNLYAESENIINEFRICDGWTVKRWKETEVENMMDTNLDGLKISFTLEFDNSEV